MIVYIVWFNGIPYMANISQVKIFAFEPQKAICKKICIFTAAKYNCTARLVKGRGF